MTVIAEFNESTGIVIAGAGYQMIGSFRVEDLQGLLSKIKPGKEVQVSYIPHNDGGNAILIQPRGVEEPHWLCACPVLHKASGPVMTFINSLFRR